MNVPTLSDDDFDYTEFGGKPPEWWQATYRIRKKPLPQVLSPENMDDLAAVIADTSLHSHVARVARSPEQDRTTLLTTSGHVIQFVPQTPASKGAIFVPRTIDAEGIALVMAAYAKDGFTFTPDQIPFGPRAAKNEPYMARMRALWTEVQQKQQPEVASRSKPAPALRAAAASVA